MSKRYYVAVIHKDPKSDYGISFPDFTCYSLGGSFEEAIRMGREALSLQVSAMIEAGEPIPDPTPPQAALSDPVFADGQAVLIGVEIPPLRQRAA